MIETRFGDMARHSALRRVSVSLNTEVTALAGELASGKVRDKTRHLRGDLTKLAAVNRAAELALVRKQSAESASLVVGVQQEVVTDLSRKAKDRWSDLTLIDQTQAAGGMAALIEVMNEDFHDLVGRLNTSVAGRSLFAGVSGDGLAVASAETLLDAMLSDLPPDADAQAFVAHVKQWFAPGGGFDTAGYLGGPAASAPLDLGQGITFRQDVTAQDAAFRTTLAAFAIGAALSRPAYPVDPESQGEVLEHAAQSLARSEAELNRLSTRIGVNEARLAEAATRAVAEHASMSIVRDTMIEADPYETASRLERALGQLDMVYTLTARLSRLSLVEYLR